MSPQRVRSSSGAEPAPEDDPAGDPETVARLICLRLLTDRARTRAELSEALRRRGVPEQAVAAVLDRFVEVGLVDDAAFAQQWVRTRHARQGLGRRALVAELRRKGVTGSVASRAVDELDAADEEKRAAELVRCRLPALGAVDDATAARRLVGMIARRGYPEGLAWRVVRAELARRGSELPEGAD